MVLTAFGPIAITRRHFGCPDCQRAEYLADPLLGIDGYLSPRVLRLACRLAGDGSFDVAAERLDELCGIEVSGETLRRHCPVAGAAMARWTRTEPAALVSFGEATGEVEVQTDAGKVNTTDGWRDLKVLVFTKRPLGPATIPTEWDNRKLPGPTARFLFADIAEIDIPFGLAVVGRPVGHWVGTGVDHAGGWGGMDLERGGGSVPGVPAGARRLPRLGTRGNSREGVVR